MFLESSQKMLIEYHYDNVQIHGHGHEHVHLSIGLTPSVVCLWNRHRKCWWNKTLAMPIFISMVMVMSIFECFRSYWSWFLGLKGLLRLVEVWKKVVQRSIWMLLLLVMSEWPKGQNSLKPCLAKCLWNRHRKCWWNKTLAMPISISMVMVTSIFECFRSCWSWFLGPKGLLRLVEVRKKVVHRSIWMSLLLVKMSEWPEGPKFFNPFLAKLGRFKAILKDHTNSTNRGGGVRPSWKIPPKVVWLIFETIP